MHESIMRTNLCCLMLASLISVPAQAEEVSAWLDGNLPAVVQLYKHLHANPELSFHEKESAARMAAELKKLGATVTTDIGGHGLVGIVKNGDGPTLMLRADMDALPVIEQTGLGYASKVKVKDDAGKTVGTMHACGHDIHMSNLIGVARYLCTHKDRWQGTLMFLLQPAEEKGAGAKAMLEDGVFKRFGKPDAALALHVSATLPAGTVSYKSGYALANVDSVDITMKGRGGHGAYPHTTIDPIVQAAQFVVSLQTIVSREVKPIEPAVITVGSIHGGTKHNIIGNSCHMQLTVRSYSDAVRRQLIEGIRRRAKAVAMGAGAPEPKIKVSEGTPSLYNNDELAARVGKVFTRVVGKDQVKSSEPSMGGEDFSRYGRAGVPILMFSLGSVAPERLARFEVLKVPPPSLHSPHFYPEPEKTLHTGIRVMTAAALDILAPNSK